MRRTTLAVLAVLVAASPAAASTRSLKPQTRTSGCIARGALPDPRCTPGSIVVASTREVVCAPGYRTTRRPVTEQTRAEVYSAYGIGKHRVGYELDHLVPLALGGSNESSNLFPQVASPKPGYHEKDRIEKRLRRFVCDSGWRLRPTQRNVARNWLKFLPGGGPGITTWRKPAPKPTPTPPPVTAGPCGTTTTYRANYAHVVWIVMENHSRTEVLPAGSYVAGLAAECTEGTNYHAVTHPSLPNYLAMTSGSTQGVVDDGPPSSHPVAGASIFAQTSWRSLQESMPSPCARSDAYPYMVKHNPAAYYTNLSACGSQDVPLASTPDLSAAFTFITPNMCNDTHDCSVGTGDAWLSGILPKIFAMPQYQDGSTAVFLTWDEDDSSASNNVALIGMSAYAHPGQKTATAYNHYSLLKTSEDMLGVSQLGGAVGAADMRSALGL